MIHKKGQGAMEYLMTYGWAILVVVIVGIVLVNMGVLDLGGQVVNTQEGFGQIKPTDWSCTAGDGAADEVSIVVANGAGGQIGNVSATIGGVAATCTPATVEAGDTTTCTSDSATVDCNADSAGAQFEVDATISYTSPSGLSKESTGTVKGSAQA
jgi:hypothetical protein